MGQEIQMKCPHNAGCTCSKNNTHPITKKSEADDIGRMFSCIEGSCSYLEELEMQERMCLDIRYFKSHLLDKEIEKLHSRIVKSRSETAKLIRPKEG